MFKALDAWVARRLFHPVIIKICQKCRCDQYTFAGHALALTGLVGFTGTAVSDQGWFGKLIGYVIFGLIILAMGYFGRLSETTKSRPFWRGLSWTLLALAVSQLGDKPDVPYRAALWFFNLWVEYALMLDRIPPEEKKQKKTERETATAS